MTLTIDYLQTMQVMSEDKDGLRYSRPAGLNNAAMYHITDGKSLDEKLAQINSMAGGRDAGLGSKYRWHKYSAQLVLAVLIGWCGGERAPQRWTPARLLCPLLSSHHHPALAPTLPHPAAAVEFAEPDYRVSVNWVPNDALLNLQWHHSTIGSQQAWQTATGKGDVKVRQGLLWLLRRAGQLHGTADQLCAAGMLPCAQHC